MIESVAIYRVDFNAVHPETWNVLGTTDDVEQAQLSPQVGDSVLLEDAEQNRCWAWVAAIYGDLVQFALDEATWRSGDSQVQIANVPPTSLLGAG